MNVVFCCDEQAIGTVNEKLSLVQTHLIEALETAKKVQNRIESKERWQGDAQVTMQSFMDLLLQYHEDLTQNGPVTDAVEHIGEFLHCLDSFEENWNEWREMGKIS